VNYCAQSQHPAEVLLTYSERTFAAVLFKTFAPFLPVTAEHVYIVTAAAATIDRLRPRANRRSADALPAATYPPLHAVAQVQCGFAADICRRRVNDRRQRSLSLSSRSSHTCRADGMYRRSHSKLPLTCRWVIILGFSGDVSSSSS